MRPAWSTEPRYRTASQKSKTNLAYLLKTVGMSHKSWRKNVIWTVTMNTCNTNMLEAEAGGFLNLRTAWSAKRPRTIRATQRNSYIEKKNVTTCRGLKFSSEIHLTPILVSGLRCRSNISPGFPVTLLKFI